MVIEEIGGLCDLQGPPTLFLREGDYYIIIGKCLTSILISLNNLAGILT